MFNLTKSQTSNKGVQFFTTLITALAGGLLFHLLQIPVPWLLGPMTAVFICSKFSKIPFYWPNWIRDTGLIIVGYSIGISFTKDAFYQIGTNLPAMLFMTVILVLFSAGIAYVVSKLSGMDYPTVLTGSIPGGLSQMITLAEEVKGIDITTVVFLQVMRVMMIIFFVPFLIFSPFFKNTAASVQPVPAGTIPFVEPTLQMVIIFTVICTLSAHIAKKLKFPTPFLLGPILGTAALTISGLHGPQVTPMILDVSQVMIGGYVGLLLKPEKLQHKTKIIILSLISGIVLIMVSLGLSFLLVHFGHNTPSTSFLSTAPGGMEQMAILAHAVQADISMVTGFQLFRLFFILFAVPPVLKLFFKARQFKKVS